MIRTIITPSTQTVLLDIPKDYVGKELEVIAFAKEEYIKTELLPKKKNNFTVLATNNKDYKFNRDEANER
jgi:hypothetical protein